MTASHFADNSFIGIDVGGSSLDVAWHRGDSAHYANRPDAIAALVKRLMKQPVTRIVIEPTGGYEKALVKALREAQLPLEIVHTTRFKAYRELLGVKAKSDTSDARLLAAYAAAPDDVRGRKAGYVELPEDAIREALSELASRRDPAQAHDPCRDLQAWHNAPGRAPAGHHDPSRGTQGRRQVDPQKDA